MIPTTTSYAPDRPDARPSPTRRRRALVTGSAALLAVGLVTGTTVAIRAGAEAAPRPPAAPLPAVETLLLERRDGYEIRRAYAARVAPARQAQLAFETGGTLVDVDVEEGDRIASGSVLARLDTRLLRAKRDQLAAARAALDSDAELASLALDRQRKLENRGFAANEALDEARLASARTGSRIAEAEAALVAVDVELDKAVLRAPFDGLVGERSLDPGATVSPGTPVLTLLEGGSPRLRVGLPPERAARLDEARTYRFVAGTREIPARLVSLRGDVDARTRTVSALFEPVAGTAETLFFGELLELVLTENLPGTVYDVPLAALAEDERGLWSVLSVTGPEAADGSDAAGGGARVDQATLRRVAVKIVHLKGERAWVSASLGEGMRIVADGSHRVVDGERVRLAAPDRDDVSKARRIAANERGA